MFKFLVILLVCVLVGVIGWHTFLLLTGGAMLAGGVMLLNGTIWGWLVILIAALCGMMLIALLFTGMLVGGLLLVMALWVILALILFPLFLPILLPLLLIALLVFYARRSAASKK